MRTIFTLAFLFSLFCLFYHAAVTTAAGTSSNTFTDGLVAYYPCNGDGNDAVGSSHGVEYQVTYGKDRFGKQNSACRFTGAANSFIAGPADKFPTKDFTVSFWFNVDTLDNRVPFSFGGISGGGQSVVVLMNYPAYPSAFTIGQHGGIVTISSKPWKVPPSLNAWHHLAVSTQSHQTGKPFTKLFLDGVLIAETESAIDKVNVYNKNFVIGGLVLVDGTAGDRTFTGDTRPCSGFVDDVRVYNVAKTNDEIRELFAVPNSDVDPMKSLPKPQQKTGYAFELIESSSANSNAILLTCLLLLMAVSYHIGRQSVSTSSSKQAAFTNSTNNNNQDANNNPKNNLNIR